ncbi:hypothetical protein OAO77_01850 [Candidatus Pelagibacter sp.]|nr:hypothetical protein [Candidatus Pelagibacter sp.]
MKNKVSLLVTTIFISLFINATQAVEKDCSTYKHKFDISICKAQNLENANNKNTESVTSSSTNKVSEAGKKTSFFFKNLGSKLKLKKHDKFRKQGE